MEASVDRKTADEKKGGKHKKKQDPSKGRATWFEIPALDIERAVGFYNAIFGIEMDISHANEFVMAYFPAGKGIGGAVVVGPGCVPSSVGTLIYLNAGKDLDAVLGRIESAGGRVIMPKTMVSEEAGQFALFIDTEGNRMALHSQS